MRAAIIHYTDRGEATAMRIGEVLSDTYAIEHFRSRCDIGGLFDSVDALIFIGACGIAVRAIAPYLKSKTTDPAVIVTDERGLNVISLISGHIGGANALTRRIAAAIDGNPVITTATDVNSRFAADEWAARQSCSINSMLAAKRFAMEILKRDLPVFSDFPIKGTPTGGLYQGAVDGFGLIISCKKHQVQADALLLIPRKLHLGIGCKRGTPAEKISAAVRRVLENEGICAQAVAQAASIDVKQDEAGLLEFCGE